MKISPLTEVLAVEQFELFELAPLHMELLKLHTWTNSKSQFQNWKWNWWCIFETKVTNIPFIIFW